MVYSFSVIVVEVVAYLPLQVHSNIAPPIIGTPFYKHTPDISTLLQ